MSIAYELRNELNACKADPRRSIERLDALADEFAVSLDFKEDIVAGNELENDVIRLISARCYRQDHPK